MDDLELLYQLDHSQVVAHAIFSFAATAAEPGEILSLDGEVDIQEVLSILSDHDREVNLTELIPGGGIIRYQGVRIFYGTACSHPSLRATKRLCVGQPVTNHRETPYEDKKPSKSLLGRLMGL